MRRQDGHDLVANTHRARLFAKCDLCKTTGTECDHPPARPSLKGGRQYHASMPLPDQHWLQRSGRPCRYRCVAGQECDYDLCAACYRNLLAILISPGRRKAAQAPSAGRPVSRPVDTAAEFVEDESLFEDEDEDEEDGGGGGKGSLSAAVAGQAAAAAVGGGGQRSALFMLQQTNKQVRGREASPRKASP